MGYARISGANRAERRQTSEQRKAKQPVHNPLPSLSALLTGD